MSQSRPAAPEPSEIAGRYQVLQKLGAGAFGTVYKAKDKVLGRMVAIKTIRLEGLAAAGASLEELMQRFKQEAQVSAQLKHPNIVTVYDIGTADGLTYLAMEFIDGVGLDRVIATEGRLPLERAASLGAQVADALDFAHRNSVVHRDIKPANIMIETGDRVKVTDFGIAKVTNSGEHLTITGSLLGTPSYMSPEQARGTELDGRSDLFAVGCVLYEMIAGKKAFRGESITGLIFKIITEEPLSLREMDPHVPDEVVRIIAKALTKAPDGRYQSGRELADDLLALTRAGSAPTLRQAETPTAPGVPQATMLISGQPPVSQTFRSPATAMGAGPTSVAPPPPPPPVPRPRAAAPRPAPRSAATPAVTTSSRSGLIVALGGAGLIAALLLGIGGWFVWQRMSAPATFPAETRDATVPSPSPKPQIAEREVPSPTPESRRPGPEDRSQPPKADEARTVAEAEKPPADRGARSVDTGPRTTPESGRTAPRSRGDREREGTPGSTPSVPEPPRTAPAGDFTFLDEEPAMDGREAGERVADAYRGQQGRNPSRPFGASGRQRPRERSPRNLLPAEIPAVATLRHLMTFQEAFNRKQGRYGTLAEMIQSQGLRLDVAAQASSFQRKGYRFEMSLTDDGFQVTAMPVGPGPRPFIGDDSGFIRAGLE